MFSNINNTNPLPFTSSSNATYRAPSVVPQPSKMTGGYTYKKKSKKNKRRFGSLNKSNPLTKSNPLNRTLMGITHGGKRSRRKKYRSKNMSRMIGMSLARGRTVTGGRKMAGGNNIISGSGSSNGSGFPTGYSLGGNYNTMGGMLANPPIYSTYSHGLIPRM